MPVVAVCGTRTHTLRYPHTAAFTYATRFTTHTLRLRFIHTFTLMPRYVYRLRFVTLPAIRYGPSPVAFAARFDMHSSVGLPFVYPHGQRTRLDYVVADADTRLRRYAPPAVAVLFCRPAHWLVLPFRLPTRADRYRFVTARYTFAPRLRFTVTVTVRVTTHAHCLYGCRCNLFTTRYRFVWFTTWFHLRYYNTTRFVWFIRWFRLVYTRTLVVTGCWLHLVVLLRVGSGYILYTLHFALPLVCLHPTVYLRYAGCPRGCYRLPTCGCIPRTLTHDRTTRLPMRLGYIATFCDGAFYGLTPL